MKPKFILLVLVLAAVGLLAGGCASYMTAASWPTVVADAERAYVAGGLHVYAVDLRNGNEIWRFPEKPSAANPFYAAPVLTVDGEQLIVAGFDHKLYSLDPVSGAQNWEFAGSRDRYFASPLIANDLIYAASADYNLYAVDLDGQLVWSFTAGQSIWAAPVSDGQNVYFGSFDRKVYALDAASGVLVWEQTLSSASLSSPVLGAAGEVFVAALDGSVYAVDAATGALLWREPFRAQAQVWASPLLVGDALCVVDTQGTVYLLDPATGGESRARLDAGGAVLNAPLLYDQTLVFGTEEGKLFLVAGEDATTLSFDGKLYSTPALSGEMILIAPFEGEATLIAATLGGVHRWTFTPER